MGRNDRDYDLVLFGATGFVGSLTARYRTGQCLPGARVALAGRSRERLASARAQVGGPAAGWDLLVANAADEAGLRGLATRTAVVLTTVGPYAEHGLPLTRACAAAGTHYADLTGEVLFVRRVIDESHAAALASGAKLVTSCGFDSVPSDLGVLALAGQAAADGEGTLGGRPAPGRGPFALSRTGPPNPRRATAPRPGPARRGSCSGSRPRRRRNRARTVQPVDRAVRHGVLAFDDLPGGGGVLTPATAMGDPLIERLRAQGFTVGVRRR